MIQQHCYANSSKVLYFFIRLEPTPDPRARKYTVPEIGGGSSPPM
ncbi:MAG: hypothetical protein ACRCYY_11615 [Trueperaceae bacterium]